MSSADDEAGLDYIKRVFFFWELPLLQNRGVSFKIEGTIMLFYDRIKGASHDNFPIFSLNSWTWC